ncbi:hypothetical protein [Actinomadura madurae]|uniref:hypothetical protein n=1 Tax=Actinomadura madurae TaxID=1993 RepID=UPI0020D24344|nr:hypothetical protein [Actinomadura madurae]MCP9984631.1 hypothetical protein [Actinomadura madurae]
MNGGTYEVIALRYGTRTGTKAEIYLNYAIYGEPDEPLGMDYFCWVARNAARTVVIDTGFGPEGAPAGTAPPWSTPSRRWRGPGWTPRRCRR